ncbi:MAG: sulfatase [Candidatus Aminicenantia bacterium]
MLRNLLIFYSLLILILNSSCRKKEFEIYRFLDQLDRKNIVSSPLIDLDAKFTSIKQECGGEDFKLLVIDSNKYWATSTIFPVLEQNEFENPEKMVILRNGKSLTYSRTPLTNSYSWRWLRGERKVEFRNYKKYKKFRHYIIFQKGEIFETSILLPSGISIFEISAKSGDPNSYLPCLEVWLNNKKIREILIGSHKVYKFIENVKLGENKLKIYFKKSYFFSRDVKNIENEIVYLDILKIKTLSDMILVSPPKNNNLLKGKFEFIYSPEPMDKIYLAKKYLTPNEYFKKILEFDSPGRKTLEIIFQSKMKNGLYSLWLGEKKIGIKKITKQGRFSCLLETMVDKKSAVLKIKLESSKRTKEAYTDFYIDSVIILNPTKTIFLPLYYLKDFKIYDSGIGENPYSIKKKLKIKGRSLNTIFSPPPSVFKFKLKIPERGILKFGYGLLDQAWEEEGNGVYFKIILENSRERKVLFSAYLNPYRRLRDRKIFYKKIDLSQYQNKTVTIYLKTYGSLPGNKVNQENPDLRYDLAFWFNPVIYQRTDDRGQRADGKVNVILISIDTLRADHLGCYGYERETSPNIDRLAQDGVLFLNTFSQAPYTLSSHMSILTGLFPTNHRVLHLSQSLSPTIQTLADLLRSNNYFTIGLTGGGQVSARYGFSKGFDLYGERVGALIHPNSAELLFNEASCWIKKNKDYKFFLFLHTYQPHNPYDSPPPLGQIFLKKGYPWKKISLQRILGYGYPHLFKRLKSNEKENLIALYDGEIRYTDEYLIKPLIEKLKKLKLYDRTMIILTSDHGEEFREHYCWGHAHTLYNELIKVPLIIKFPKSNYRGRKIDNFIRSVDIMPTILEQAGIDFSGLSLDGESLLKILNNKEKKERLCMSYLANEVVRYIPRKVSIVQGKNKLIFNESYSLKAYQFFSPPPPPQEKIELYRLMTDPLEKNNLASQREKLVQELFNKVEFYLKEGKRQEKIQKIILDKTLEERLKALGYIK